MSESRERASALLDPASTPGRKDVATLLALVLEGDDKDARAAGRALSRIQSPVVSRLLDGICERSARDRARVLAAVAQRVGKGEDDAIFAASAAHLDADDAIVRKAAVRGLSSLSSAQQNPAASRALLDLAAHESEASVLRALARALSPLGASEELRGVLERLEQLGSPVPAKQRMIAAREGAGAAGALRENVRLPDSLLSFSCRRGLEEVLRQELQGAGLAREVRVLEGCVDTRFAGMLTDAFRLRTALSFSLVVRSADKQEGDAATRIAQALAGPEAARIFGQVTDGPVHYRLELGDQQKHRGLLWQIAERADALSKGQLLSAPRNRNWDVTAHLGQQGVRLELHPRLADNRFAYRLGDVPAASHPTLAAALAFVGEASPGDVVFDPFVGSGLELCERALLGPYARLLGSDHDARALQRASENLVSVGASRHELRQADAREGPNEEISLMLSNPPMGRRVERGEDLDGLLADVLTAAARRLRRGGRVVWLSPRPRTTRSVAESLGLRLERCTNVDMGGFDAELQRFDRPGGR